MEAVAEMTLWQSLHHLDKALTLEINSFHCGFSDFAWRFFSTQEVWYVMYLIVAFFFFRNLGWKKALVYVVAMILCIVASDQSSNIVKHAVGRLRPCHDLDMIAGGLNVLESPGGKYGFFSSHASNSIAFAIVSILAFKHDRKHRYCTYDILIVLWALLVGISRVFVGKHFLGDVLTGFAVGALYAWFFGALAAWSCRKLKLSSRRKGR